ncbi:MAG: amidohydrolase family protein [Phycisphaerales bacterium JB047]
MSPTARLATCVFLLIISCTATRLAAETALIHCGHLIAVPGQPTQSKMTIVVIDDRIDRVIAGYAQPENLGFDENTTVIDLTEHWVVPGLIDCHTHLTGQIKPALERMRSRMQEGEAHAAIDAVANAHKTLMAGFTTVRNVGSPGSVGLALRDRINQGVVPGPRMFVSGPPVSVTGGHGDPTNSLSPALRPDLDDQLAPADGPYEARKAVRARIREGVDLIKITATGGVLSPTAAGVEQQFFVDELESIVQAARTMGRKVAAHAHGTNGINAALRAGVDSIEHGTYLDDESIDLFKKTGAYLVPTIHAGKFVEEKAKVDGYFPPSIRDKAAAVGPLIQDSFARAYNAGVNIAFGTDVGVGAHGTNALEFIYMHEAGMTPEDCLISATINAAKLIGAQDQLGTLESGKYADLIALPRDPMADVTAYQDVMFVMKGGEVFLTK